MTEPPVTAPPVTDSARLETPVPGTRVRAFLGLAAVAAVLFVLVYGVAVQTVRGQRFDAHALAGRGAADARPRVARATGRLLTTISVGSVALVGAGIVLVALGRGRPHLAVAAGLVVFGSIVSAEVLKHVVLPRPDLIGPDAHGFIHTFPSGHTATATSLAMAAMLVVPHRARIVVAVVGGLYAIAIGGALLTSGAHRPSDVLGSLLLVTCWTALAAAWLASAHGRLVRNRGPRRSTTPVIPPPIARLAAAVLAVAFLGLLVVTALIGRDRVDAADLGTAYTAASLAILAFGVTVFSAVTFLLRGLTLDPPVEAGDT